MTARTGRDRGPHAGVPGRRLFVAVPIPNQAEAQIAAVVEQVRGAGVPGGGRDVRWVRLDSLHITLRFLGPTADDRIEATADATLAAAAAAAPFEVAIGGAGAFPNAARPRALWLDIRTGADELAGLAAAVDDRLRDAGWVLEERPLRAHLTLARADGVRAGSAVGARLVAAAEDLDVRFQADRVGLFESVVGRGPARYDAVAVAELG